MLSKDIGYVLYSALGSFYVPSIIMIFVYIRIYFAARSRARRYVKRRPRAGPVPPTPQTAVEVHHSMPPSGDTDSRKSSAWQRGAEPERSSSDSGPQASRCNAVLPLRRHLRAPVWGRKTSKAKREMIDMGRLKVRVETPAVSDAPAVEVAVRHRDPDREKRRIARKKEKRATLILGLIMGSFIACWLPFFFLYVLVPLCSSCHVADWGFAFAFWLGYMNSALNPVIYTIFNKDFRRAFRRILFK
ncbi:Octopamine receptor [Amphibalanus amphitrite]|uniref:Octopamine receptor n=1 Tax=Amphibalanus amphitrite TaxID=1232801 RepID=A0A6A4W1Z2_AMPAM|nr:Octopamine receptor [Amphibalanus amphitrite]